MLHRIAYTSRAAIAPALVIHDIISTCRHFNEAHGITGLLLCDGSRYVQALEGEEDVVRKVGERVFADTRHCGFEIMHDDSVASWEFGCWSLNYHLQPSSLAAHTYVDAVMRDVAQVTDPALKAYFIGFAALAR